VELRRYFAILRRRGLLIALTVAAGIVASYLSTSRVEVYTAQSTIYVGSRRIEVVSGDFSVGLDRIIQTYAAMIDSDPTAAEALDATGLQRSTQSVVDATEVAPAPGTQLLRVTVRDSDPSAAQQLANGMANAFVEKISSFEPSAAPQPGEVPQLPAYVYERAQLPTSPIPTGLGRRLFLGALFGFVLAAACAFLLEYLDVTIKSAADAERWLGLPVLGVIPVERPIGAPPASARAPVTI
jgi:capsular polysaccharide biosynthesis protein